MCVVFLGAPQNGVLCPKNLDLGGEPVGFTIGVPKKSPLEKGGNSPQKTDEPVGF